MNLNISTPKAKKRGKIRKVGLSFQASRRFAGCLDEAAARFAKGNASEYVREAVRNRMIEDGIFVDASAV
jgi:hypothetical protein